MVFIIALKTPWCRYLESLAGISPQLYADNIKCTSYSVDSVLAAAQYTVSYVRAVGQEASPSKCVLLCTSKAARRRMTSWRNRNEGCFWAVKLDVRDLGGHLDVTLRAVAGTLSSRVRIATTQVPAVGALRFNACLEWCVRNICLGVFMVVKVLLFSVTAHSSFRSAIARAVWSKKLPLTNTPALLSLLDGPWGSDPAFSSFGIVFVNSDVILRIVLMIKIAFFVYWTMPLLGPRGMGPFIFSFSLLMNLVFSGILQAGWNSAWSSSPGQSVQRAEYCGVILALQAYSGIHVGIDNSSLP